jgi:imidazolonepropionase
MKPDLLLTHIGQLATLAGNSDHPKTGDELGDLAIIVDGAIAIKDGKILAVGTTKDVISQFDEEPVLPGIEFPGMFAMPGLVDSHTHLIFGGFRENDFAMKLAGKTYMEILEAGGGILNTLRATRQASREDLCHSAFTYGESMLASGTTTVEVKSGYGLSRNDEVKMLHAAGDLSDCLPMGITRTFLGAHAVPPEYEGKTDDYVNVVIDEMIPAVTELEIAEFCDVFCEKGVFDIEQSRRILLAAKEAGMKLKVHADEIVQLGGAGLAAEVGAVSADHLLMASDEGLEAMLKTGTIATLLPATAFSLNTAYARARYMIEMGLPVALATDFNPNCANESLFFTIALATYKMKMTAREAISATTINGAHALDKGHEIGSLEPGKRADILVLECPNPEFLTWRFGVNLVHTVIANGQVVHTKLGP